jgi:hypothetical protein
MNRSATNNNQINMALCIKCSIQDNSLPNADTQRMYDLDGLGNWRRTVYTPEGGSQQFGRIKGDATLLLIDSRPLFFVPMTIQAKP